MKIITVFLVLSLAVAVSAGPFTAGTEKYYKPSEKVMGYYASYAKASTARVDVKKISGLRYRDQFGMIKTTSRGEANDKRKALNDAYLATKVEPAKKVYSSALGREKEIRAKYKSREGRRFASLGQI